MVDRSIGAKFGFDISDLKYGVTEANRLIRLADSEFKNASAGMGDWTKSADGLEAKQRQLNATLEAQKSTYANYAKDLDAVKQKYGENSREAVELEIKLNRQAAALKTTEQSLKETKESLKNFGNETSEASAKTEKLSNGFKDFFAAGMALKGIDAILGKIKSSLDGAISRIDTLNTFPQVMEGMGFSAEKAEEATRKLSSGIQGLPTTLDGIVGITQSLVTMTQDLETSTDTALALNNAMLASGSAGEKASRGMNMYISMLSSGEVSAQRWRTLQETMGYALQKTAESFGYAGQAAQNDLFKALQSGEITFSDFNARIIELSDGVDGFASKSAVATSGIATGISNASTAIARGTASWVDSINKASDSMGGIGGVASSIGKTIENSMKTAAPAIGNVAGLLVKHEYAVKSLVATILIYQGAVGLSTALNAKLTAATGAQTFAEVNAATVKALLTKKVTALNAALAANPYAFVIAGFTALGLVIKNFIDKQAEAMLQTGMLNENLLKQNEILSKDFGKEKAKSLQEMAERYDELRLAAQLTNDEAAELARLSQDLAGILPQGTSLIDEQTGAYKALGGGVSEAIEAMELQAHIAKQTSLKEHWEEELATMRGYVDAVEKTIKEDYETRANYAEMNEESMNALRRAIADELEAYNQMFEDLQKSNKSFAEQFYQSEVDILEAEFKDKLEAVMGEIPDNLELVGAEAIEGFLNGLKKRAHEVPELMRNLMKEALDAGRDALDIRSPSHEMESMADDTIDGFIKQTQRRFSEMRETYSRLGETAVNALQASLTDSGGVLGGLDNLMPDIKKSKGIFKELFNNILGDGFIEGLAVTADSLKYAANLPRRGGESFNESRDGINSGNVIHFTQNNTSPRALDNLEIERKTRQGLQLATFGLK
ncbi:MAG: tape measure protein [Oscillospiraceae bacterium]|nr:tape measure protein [Oscillospiraceae bacterium]